MFTVRPKLQKKYFKVKMSFFNVSIGHLTSTSRKPSDFLPVFLLILQEDSLIIQILSNFDYDIFRLVDFTSNIESFNSICNVSDSILLSFSVFNR